MADLSKCLDVFINPLNANPKFRNVSAIGSLKVHERALFSLPNVEIVFGTIEEIHGINQQFLEEIERSGSYLGLTRRSS